MCRDMFYIGSSIPVGNPEAKVMRLAEAKRKINQKTEDYKNLISYLPDLVKINENYSNLENKTRLEVQSKLNSSDPVSLKGS